VGERVTRDLPAGDAPAVGEDRQEERIDVGPLLYGVEHRLDALVHERHGPDLDADDLRGRLRPGFGRRLAGPGGRGGEGGPGRLEHLPSSPGSPFAGRGHGTRSFSGARAGGAAFPALVKSYRKMPRPTPAGSPTFAIWNAMDLPSSLTTGLDAL